MCELHLGVPIPDDAMEEVRNQLHLVDNAVYRIQKVINTNDTLGKCIDNIRGQVRFLSDLTTNNVSCEGLDRLEELIDQLQGAFPPEREATDEKAIKYSKSIYEVGYRIHAIEHFIREIKPSSQILAIQDTLGVVKEELPSLEDQLHRLRKIEDKEPSWRFKEEP